MLEELEPHLGTIPPAMITWISSTAKTYREYRVPFAYDYLKAQKVSGHTDHYLRLFKKHREEYLQTKRSLEEQTRGDCMLTHGRCAEQHGGAGCP